MTEYDAGAAAQGMALALSVPAVVSWPPACRRKASLACAVAARSLRSTMAMLPPRACTVP